MMRRSFDVYDYRATHYFRQLREFLGAVEINERLTKLERQLKSEKGLFLQNWVIPRQAWWVGLRQALEMVDTNKSFRRALTPLLEYPLQSAVKLSRFHNSMPDWKKDEFRSRLLSDDHPDDVLFELDTAADYYGMGYDITWIEPESIEGKQTTEFIAYAGDIEFEVECKSKEADAGRKIERAAFYRLADLVVPVIQKKGLCGKVSITVPKRLPTDNPWRSGIVDVLKEECEPKVHCFIHEGDVRIDIDLSRASHKALSLNSLYRSIDLQSQPYAHHVIAGKKTYSEIVSPVILRVESATRDEFLANVLISLRKANRQFSGNSSGIICCHLPEIESFEGLEKDSSLKTMTAKFFEKHANPYIYTVSYVSEARRDIIGQIILTDMPALIFRSNTYTGTLPDDIPLSS